MSGCLFTCRVPLGSDPHDLGVLNFSLLDFENTFLKKVQIQSTNKNEISKFIILEKEKFKNQRL